MSDPRSQRIKIFVINLKRSPHRRQHMEEQLRSLDLKYEIIEGTDGLELTDTDIRNLYSKERSLKHLREPLRTNEIACADSHLRVYQTILDRDLPQTLILEDDAILSRDILKILDPNFLRHADYDWLQLDYPTVGWPFLKKWLQGSLIYSKRNFLFIFYALLKLPYITVLSLYESWREKRCRKKGLSVVSFARPLYLASAYIVTKRGAEKLIKTGRPIAFAADMLPNKTRVMNNLKMKAICPPLAYQDKAFDSDIGKR